MAQGPPRLPERLLERARPERRRRADERDVVLALAEDVPAARSKAGLQNITVMPQPIVDGLSLGRPIGSFRADVKVPPGRKLLSSNLPALEEKLADGGRRYTLSRDNAYVPALMLSVIDAVPDLSVVRSERLQVAANESTFTDRVRNLGTKTVPHAVVRGFLPFVERMEIDAGDDAAVLVRPENTGYFYSVMFAELPAGSERTIEYRFSHDVEQQAFSLGRAQVAVENKIVALSAYPQPSGTELVRAAGLSSLRPAAARVFPGGPVPVECGPNQCGGCLKERVCNRYSPHCKWVGGRCLPSCGALGGSCQSSAGGTRICLEDKGQSWDCELCCADPTTTINCLRAAPWGTSGCARFINAFNTGQCQPGILCDMQAIQAGGCWLALQACWAMEDWANEVGRHWSDFSQDDYVLAVLLYVHDHMAYRIDEENEDCLCPRINWCFGSPRIVPCGGYSVSWAWWLDWGCDYPVAAKLLSETGACSYCGNSYCGDCEDHAFLRAGLLRSVGFHPDCIWVAWRPGHTFNHCVVGGAWRICDYDSEPDYFSSDYSSHWSREVCNDYHGDYFSAPGGTISASRDFTWNYPRYYNGASQEKTCTYAYDGLLAYLVSHCP